MPNNNDTQDQHSSESELEKLRGELAQLRTEQAGKIEKIENQINLAAQLNDLKSTVDQRWNTLQFWAKYGSLGGTIILVLIGLLGVKSLNDLNLEAKSKALAMLDSSIRPTLNNKIDTLTTYL